MIKNILAVIGVLAIVAGAAALVVLRPWEPRADIVADESPSPVVRADDLRFEGVECHRVTVTVDRGRPKARLYLSFSKFYAGTVLLKAFDKAGTEIGRAKREISGNTEEAGYVDFEFDGRVPLNSSMFFTLTKSQVAPQPAPEAEPVAVPADAEEKSLTESAPAAEPEPAPVADVPAPAIEG